jgi:hypothetical protein
MQAMRGMANPIDGVLADGCVLICDRDRKWSRAVLEFLEHEVFGSSGRRFVRSIKEECLERMIPLGSDIFGAPSPNSWPTIMASGIIRASGTN